jgi:hypothetical protein
MPRCGRLSCFHVRLEGPLPKERGRDSCGTHLAEVVHELASRAREQRKRPGRVVVYAMTERRSAAAGPFDQLALGAIPV